MEDVRAVQREDLFAAPGVSLGGAHDRAAPTS
jgi:hypothetical protein